MKEYITLNDLSKIIKCNKELIKEAMFYLGLFEYDKNFNYRLTKLFF